MIFLKKYIILIMRFIGSRTYTECVEQSLQDPRCSEQRIPALAEKCITQPHAVQ